MRGLLAELGYQIRYGIPVWLCQTILCWLPDIGPVIRLRGLLVSIFLPGRPKRFGLGRDVTMLSIHRLKVGRSVYFAKGTWINAIGGLDVGDEVVTAPYVIISTSNHGFKNGSVVGGGSHLAATAIGCGTWLAAHAVVTAGVSVGGGNIVGANAVVTRDSPDDVILVGAPAKVLGARVDNPSDVQSKHGG